MKNSTICATNVRTMRMTKKIMRGKLEIRNPKFETNSNEQRLRSETDSFEFRASSLFRISSFSACYHKHILEMRKIHRRRYPRLAVELTHPKTLDRADEQAGWKNSAHA